MIALISALLGYLGTAAGEYFKIRQDSKDKAHELALLQYQAQLDVQRADADLDKSLAIATSAQFTAVQESYQNDIQANAKLKNDWVVGYSATVRPTITYMFFLLYAGVKVAQFHSLMNPEFPWQQTASYAQAIVGVWGSADAAIFEAVIGFWFGSKLTRSK